MYVQRKYQLHDPQQTEREDKSSYSFDHFYNKNIIVVLGQPGQGKSTEFQYYANLEPEAEYLKVGQFLNLPDSKLKAPAFYIDGLDEFRARKGSTHVLEAIGAKLEALNWPKARIACRTNDWYGDIDLSSVSNRHPSKNAATLSLLPLSYEYITDITREKLAPRHTLFLEEAYNRDLGKQLGNPLTLQLYIDYFQKKGHWPTSETALFESFCETLCSEKNPEHLAKREPEVTDTNIIDASAEAAAFLLLINKEFISIGQAADSGNECISTGVIRSVDQLHLREALRTRLFEQLGENRFRFTHRKIMEFLAAQSLVKKIQQNSLPLTRLIAALTGGLGAPPSDMRGLFSWLITLLPKHAPTLLALDPYGAVTMGDPASWPVNTKLEAWSQIKRLAADDPYFHRNRKPPSIGGIICPQLASELDAVLKTPPDNQLASFTLSAIGRGHPIGSLKPTLLQLLESPHGKHSSYRLVEAVVNTYGSERVLRRALYLAHTDSNFDKDFGSRTALLEKLYPHYISPRLASRYLVNDSIENSLMDYGIFLGFTAPQNTPTEKLAETLNQFSKDGIIDEDHSLNNRARFFGKLLASAIQKEVGSSDDLYSWLNATVKNYYQCLDGDTVSDIQNLLFERPRILQDLLLIWWKSTAHMTQSELWASYQKFRHSICGIDLRKTWSSVIFHMLLSTSGTLRRTFLIEAYSASILGRAPKKLEKAITFLDVLSHFPGTLTLLFDRASRMVRKFKRSKETEAEIRKSQQRQQNIEILSDQLESLRSGNNKNLDNAARRWLWNHDVDRPNSILEIIKKELNGELADIFLEGFRNALLHGAHQTPTDLINLYKEDKRPYLALPSVVGAELLFQENCAVFNAMPNNIFERLLIYNILYCVTGKLPDWFLSIVQNHTFLTQAVLERVWTEIPSHGETSPRGIPSPKASEAYKACAGVAATNVLRTSPDLPAKHIHELLLCALQHGQSRVTEGNALTGYRNASSSSKLLWMCLLFVQRPEFWSIPLAASIRSEQDLGYAFNTILHVDHLQNTNKRSISFFSNFIGLFGKRLKNTHDITSGYVPDWDPDDAARTIRELISNLAGIPSNSAQEALKDLVKDRFLGDWRKELKHARSINMELIRDTQYSHPTIDQTLALLANGPPCNHMDFQAYLVATLESLKTTLRSENTDPWKNFWNTGSSGQAKTPKVENICRDIILHQINLAYLHNEIRGEPEQLCQFSKRADIMFHSGKLRIPIEAKRAWHQDLWTAADTQLSKFYTQNKGAEGFGIYLVFWFGSEKVTIPPAGIAKPTSASDLEKALSEHLAEHLKPTIKVVVLDLEKPE